MCTYVGKIYFTYREKDQKYLINLCPLFLLIFFFFCCWVSLSLYACYLTTYFTLFCTLTVYIFLNLLFQLLCKLFYFFHPIKGPILFWVVDETCWKENKLVIYSYPKYILFFPVLFLFVYLKNVLF